MPLSGGRPRAQKAGTNTVELPTTRRSQAQASPTPAPAAAPSMAATVGTGSARSFRVIVCMATRTGVSSSSARPVLAARWNRLRSAPTQKAGPSADTTSAPMPSGRSSRAAMASPTKAASTALRVSGRRRVSQPIPSSTVMSTLVVIGPHRSAP